MYKIIHTASCADVAARLADRLYGSIPVPIESVLADPESLGDLQTDSTEAYLYRLKAYLPIRNRSETCRQTLRKHTCTD